MTSGEGLARAWFREAFEGPTPVQEQGWPLIDAGRHVLLLAPTGRGKTLAAFLALIDRLITNPSEAPSVRVLYVSPLKALAYDIERNLRAPLAGVARLGGDPRVLPRVGLRTGDTSPKEREALRREPPDILVTTPESLYLMLGSRVRETLCSVEAVIVDEIHDLVPTKRGSHLSLSLERLAALTEKDPQRIGLSATARPVELVARFLGGDRAVEIVDTSETPDLDLRVVVPMDDMERPPEVLASLPADGSETPLLARLSPPAPSQIAGVWPAIYARLLEDIGKCRSTIAFVNSRGLCERLARHLNELAEGTEDATSDLVRTHHGSLSLARRRAVEDDLKRGEVRAIVATSSLELGIDMAAVDQVICVEAPPSVASGLQRVGRAGHAVGVRSRGYILPKHRGDLLAASVVADRMRQGLIEELAMPERPLDVLAQQLVAIVATEPTTLEAAEALVRRAAPFRELSRELFVATLDMLCGRFAAEDFADLRPRLVWDRHTGDLRARRGSKTLSLISGGTIPDRGLYPVRLGPDGPRVGELDEEMVHETRPGQVITLGTTSWRVLEITRDRVIVQAAAGEAGRLPFWRGDGPGRPAELGLAIGVFLRRMERLPGEERMQRLQTDHGLDPQAASNLNRYLGEQTTATGALPTDRRLVVESFRDELGDWRLCLLAPLGARVLAPLALAIEARLGREFSTTGQVLWTDDGIVVRMADGDRLPDLDEILPDVEELEAQVTETLAGSPLFAQAFRENAARALLLPRRKPGQRTPLWVQRLRAQSLLSVVQTHPSFPIVLETYRHCLRDVFDLPATKALLTGLRDRSIRIKRVTTDAPSPFARSLVFAFTQQFLYEGDLPASERRAQALTLDRRLLRELLGEEDLRQLLDARSIAAVHAELQAMADGFRARDPDELHDLLRRLGDLSADEIQARCDGDGAAWTQGLVGGGRAIWLRIAGDHRLVAIEDAAWFRDALGLPLPLGLPEDLLTGVDEALPRLELHLARRRGPFVLAELAARYGLARPALLAILSAPEAEGRILRGGFLPGGDGEEWCDPEVLRRIKRRTLAHLRDEVAPVEPEALVRFLADWQGLNADSCSDDEALERIVGLEGLSLSLRDLETRILPARGIRDPASHLDRLCASGELVWVGQGAVDARDLRIVLLRRDRADLLGTLPPPAEDPSPARRSIVETLSTRGACFFSELWSAGREHRQEDLDQALWDLVLEGQVTNDGLDVLRRRGRGRSARPRGTRGSLPGGRWSLVSSLFHAERSDTERVHARVTTLLERYGLLTSTAVLGEETPGGFAGLYPVLRTMEDSGLVRRGHFADGQGGAQFALPGAVDRLRAARRVPTAAKARTLATCDPAQPYGQLLPWPDLRSESAPRPKRQPGTQVVILDASCVLWVGRKGRQIVLFDDDTDHLEMALRALCQASRDGGALRIERIDGEPATASRWTALFIQSGFRNDYRSLSTD